MEVGHGHLGIQQIFNSYHILGSEMGTTYISWNLLI